MQHTTSQLAKENTVGGSAELITMLLMHSPETMTEQTTH